MNKKGFSLIEVILAISILSTLSVLVATSLGRALKARTKIQAEVQGVSGLRDAVKIMRADIYLAYNH
jgi:prepilin-type N-terminal cleavage/methylation domain-containing protein